MAAHNFCRHQAPTYCSHIPAGKTLINIIIKQLKHTLLKQDVGHGGACLFNLSQLTGGQGRSLCVPGQLSLYSKIQSWKKELKKERWKRWFSSQLLWTSGVSRKVSPRRWPIVFPTEGLMYDPRAAADQGRGESTKTHLLLPFQVPDLPPIYCAS